MWTAYMKAVLADVPEAAPPPPPPGLVKVQAVDLNTSSGIVEDYMYEENVPASPQPWQNPDQDSWHPFDQSNHGG
jgi:hypothetical protein